MEDIIKRIIEIDREAQKKFKSADEYQQNAQKEIEESTHYIDEKMRAKSEERLQNVKSSQEAVFTEKAAEFSKLSEQKKSRLDQIYQEKHDQWEKDLFEKVLH